MTQGRAEQIIVISLLVTLASTVGGGLSGHKNKSRTGKVESNEKYYGKAITGGFLTFLALSLLAEATPEPAAYMSIGVSTFAFFHYGLPAVSPQSAVETKNVSAGPSFVEPAISLFGGTLV